MSRLSKVVLILAVLALTIPVLTSCQPKEVIVKETVVVEKEVEKVVKETVVVEVAAATPEPVYDFDENVTPNERYEIAVVLKNFTSPFWLTHRKWAEQAGEDYGVDVTVLAPAKPENIEEQIRILEDLIQKGVDGVIIAPTSTDGIAPGIQKLNDAGIPVIYDNTRGSGGDYVCYIGADNVLIGQTVAAAMVERMGESGKVLVLEGFPGQQTADDRRKGMNDFLSKYPDIEVISQTAHWRRTEGMQVTENVLQRWPDITGIIGASNEMPLGGIEALRSAGIPFEQVVIGGVDAYEDVVIAMEAGEIDFAVSQSPFKQAYWSVVAMIKHLNGEDVPIEIRTPAIVVTLDNVDQYAEVVD